MDQIESDLSDMGYPIEVISGVQKQIRDKWLKYGECIKIQFNIVANTATVIEVTNK